MVTIEITNIKQRVDDNEEVESYVVEYRIPEYPNTYQTDPIPADEFNHELAKERVEQEASPLISGTTIEVKLPNETTDTSDGGGRRDLLKYGVAALLGIGTIAGGGIGAAVLGGGEILGGRTNSTPTPGAQMAEVSSTDQKTETPTTETGNVIFSDEFEDGVYSNTWSVTTHHDVESVSESNGMLTCVSPPDETAYAPDMTVLTDEMFEANGALRFIARHKVEDSGYWTSKIFRILDQNTESQIQLEEKPHNDVGFNIRGPQDQETVLNSTTADTEWKTYALEVDFENDTILTVERDGEVYELNQDMGGEFSEFRLGLAENNCTDSFETVSISQIETSTPTPASTDGRVIGDFEEGWDGFEVLVNEKLENGTDASAERTNDDSARGDWSVRGACSKNGQEGDVVVRKTSIDVSEVERLVFSAKLIIGNTYGSPRFFVYEGSEPNDDNSIVRYDIREQEENVWEENMFDISDVSTITIDMLIGSGAGTEQEALYDYIYVT